MNRLARTVLDRVRRDDRGLTLVELLIAMGLFAVLLAIVGGTFYSITTATTFAAARDQNGRAASTAMNEVVRKVRSAADNPRLGTSDAPAFAVAGTNTVQFTTLVATGRTAAPQQVRFTVGSSGTLTEQIVPGVTTDNAYYTFPGSGTTTTITSSIEVPAAGATPVFEYLQLSGATLTPDPSTGLLSAAQLGQIAFVRVTLRVSSSASTLQNGTTLRNTIGLPNLLDPTGDQS